MTKRHVSGGALAFVRARWKKIDASFCVCISMLILNCIFLQFLPHLHCPLMLEMSSGFGDIEGLVNKILILKNFSFVFVFVFHSIPRVSGGAAAESKVSSTKVSSRRSARPCALRSPPGLYFDLEIQQIHMDRPKIEAKNTTNTNEYAALLTDCMVMASELTLKIERMPQNKKIPSMCFKLSILTGLKTRSEVFESIFVN